MERLREHERWEREKREGRRKEAMMWRGYRREIKDREKGGKEKGRLGL